MKLGADLDGLIPTVYHFDEHTGELHVERLQPDVEPVMDRCKALQAAGWDGYNGDRSMKEIADVPMAVIEQWAKEGVDIFNPDHNAEVLKRLNDPALKHFRSDIGANSASGIIIKGAR